MQRVQTVTNIYQGRLPLCLSAEAVATNQLTNERENNMNTITLTGNVKNIQARGTTGSIWTANISQRDSDGKCVTTMPLVFINNQDEVKYAEANQDQELYISGKLVTRFDRRPGIENSQRFKPFTQIEVEHVALKSAVYNVSKSTVNNN